MSYWTDHSKPVEPLTRERMEAAVAQIKLDMNKPQYPHGHELNPHLCSPVSGRCYGCGQVFEHIKNSYREGKV